MKLVYETPSVDESLAGIALESAMLNNLSASIANLFPDLLSKLSGSFSMSGDIPVVVVHQTKEQKFVQDNAHGKQWLDIADLQVMVPEGFKGKMVDYGKVLYDNSKGMSNVIEDVLKPYVVYLSQFLANKDVKRNTKDLKPLYVELAKKREDAVAAMDVFRVPGSDAKAKIGEILDRKADLMHLHDAANNIARILENVDLGSVKEMVKQAVDLLELIVKQSKEGDIENVSPEATQNLAFGATEIAREVEYLSLLHFRCLNYTTSVDDITHTVGKFIRGAA